MTLDEIGGKLDKIIEILERSEIRSEIDFYIPEQKQDTISTYNRENDVLNGHFFEI